VTRAFSSLFLAALLWATPALAAEGEPSSFEERPLALYAQFGFGRIIAGELTCSSSGCDPSDWNKVLYVGTGFGWAF
jgi:hypothetical protein